MRTSPVSCRYHAFPCRQRNFRDNDAVRRRIIFHSGKNWRNLAGISPIPGAKARNWFLRQFSTQHSGAVGLSSPIFFRGNGRGPNFGPQKGIPNGKGGRFGKKLSGVSPRGAPGGHFPRAGSPAIFRARFQGNLEGPRRGNPGPQKKRRGKKARGGKFGFLKPGKAKFRNAGLQRIRKAEGSFGIPPNAVSPVSLIGARPTH